MSRLIGILCEKPSAMRNFSKALGGDTGTFNGESYVITCAAGHLYEFDSPEKQVLPALAEKYKSWSLDNLPWEEKDFKWTYTKKPNTSSLLNNIKSTLSKCDEIVIATDNDPTGEGELLAWEILDGLNLAPKTWSRMYFEDESVKEVQKAFVNRKQIKSMQTDMDYVKAVYRSRWDFLSMQFTRIATSCGDGKTVLRNGRLKSFMVVLVGDQLKAVAAYKKVPFYSNKFKDENGIVYTNPEEPTFPKKDQVPQTYHSSTVTCDSKEMRSTAPPKMLDLASLAAKLSGKYKSKDIAAVYQKMYEAQVVSYPRTEDKKISPEQFNDLLPLVDKIAAVVGVDPKLLTHRTPRSTHVATGMAHGANRPGTNVPTSLAELSKFGACAADIYEILAKNYLATLAEDYEYEFQKGHVTEYPKFVGSASVPKKLGWKAVYNDADDDADDSSATGLGTKADPFVHEGFPPKPATPTVKWLMKQLERYDVGTGATRLSTYTEVTNDKSKYPLMKDTKGKITFARCGEMNYRLLPGTHIGSRELTEMVLSQMRSIAKGEMDPAQGLRDIQQMVRDDIETMKKNGITMRKEMNIMSTTAAAERYKGVFNGEDVSFKRTWSGHDFTDEECEKLCNGETIEIEAVSQKNGKTFKCKGKLEKQEFKGKEFYGFKADFSSGGGVPDEWCKHKFTADEKAMLESGMSVECTDFVSSKGKKFSAKVRYGKNDRGFMGIIPEFG